MNENEKYQWDPVPKDNIGLADYENERFGVSLTISTLDKRNEKATELVEYNFFPYPISLVDLMHLVSHMYGAMYNEAKIVEESEIVYSDEELVRIRELINYVGSGIEDLQGYTDCLLLEFDDEGNITNRLNSM